MAEQYVYTRSKSKQGNFSGFTCRTEGIVGTVQREVQTLAMKECRIKNDRNGYVPVWEKRVLSGGYDRVILQQTVYTAKADRFTQTSSGYVLDLNEELLNHPLAWGGLSYEVQDGEPISLAPQAISLRPLSEVLAFYNMSGARLLQLIKGCFDVKRSGSMVLIETDFSQKNASDMGMQLLLWIYCFLPNAMRRELNCSSCFDGDLNGGCHLGLIPARLLEDSGFRRGFLAGGGLLYSGGEVECDPAVCRSYYSGKDGSYSRWLSLMIDYALNPGKIRPQKLQSGIDAVYRGFDIMIRSLPAQDRCSPNYYDALSWNLFRQGMEPTKKPLPTARDLTYFEDFMAFGSWPEVIDSLPDILDALALLYNTPASEQIIRLLTKILQLDGAGDKLDDAWELLSAILARDMEAVGADESSSVSARYLRLMESAGMERSKALQALSRVFFPDAVRNGKTEAYTALWKQIGTNRSAGEGLRRCSDWMSSYVNVCLNADELIDCAGTVIDELDGFVPRHLEQALDCLLGAQETRCYYARLEILPAHLTACFKKISNVWSRGPELYRQVIEHYYTQLRTLLLREYARCWSGRSTLSTVCSLANAFRREAWYIQGKSYIRELILTQCADICEYDWDQLKQQFRHEDSAILQRLWQVLDLLDEFVPEVDLKNLLTRQICRYILHSVPAYVNDNWIVCEVRERPDLRREGYYLELLALREFLQGSEQTLERLQVCIKRNHVSTELMKDMLKFLYRVFQQGGLSRLEPVAAEGIYIAVRDRLKITQLDVFRTICEIRGGNALLQMLGQWPAAAPAQPASSRQAKLAEANRRKGTYPWLKTNQNLMDALFRLSQDKKTLRQAAGSNETWYLAFAEAVDALAPPGSKVRPTAIRINEQLLALQEEHAGLKIRMQCSARKRRLLSE